MIENNKNDLAQVEAVTRYKARRLRMEETTGRVFIDFSKGGATRTNDNNNNKKQKRARA